MTHPSKVKPLFSTRTSLIIGTVLLFPFVVRTLAPALEPYPAIVLPSVATQIDIGKNVAEFRTTTIYGYDREKNWKKIDPVKLLEPIPVQYLPKITSHQFGLTRTVYEVDNKILRNLQIEGKPVSQEQEKQAKIWLSNRLQSLGFLNSHIRISHEVIKRHLGSGKIINRKIEDEKTIRLL